MMHLVYRAVLKIGELLPLRIAVVFDSLSNKDWQYVAIFENFPVERPCEYDIVMLGIERVGDEDCR